MLDELVKLHGWKDDKDDGLLEAMGIRSFQHGLVKQMRLVASCTYALFKLLFEIHSLRQQGRRVRSKDWPISISWPSVANAVLFVKSHP